VINHSIVFGLTPQGIVSPIISLEAFLYDLAEKWLTQCKSAIIQSYLNGIFGDFICNKFEQDEDL
jgi:hypothetical protein